MLSLNVDPEKNIKSEKQVKLYKDSHKHKPVINK